MSTGVHGPTRARIEAKTLRTDRWWLYPLTVFVVFTAFVVYATFRAFQGSALLLARPTSRRSTRRASADCVERQLRLRPAVRLVAAVAGAAHPDLPARLPADLLLLPQGLLPRRSG